MRKNFDTFEYVDDLGNDLVRDFEKAGKTTHPHSVGEGREKSAINKLKDILPSGIGVGSGFVIDSRIINISVNSINILIKIIAHNRKTSIRNLFSYER